MAHGWVWGALGGADGAGAALLALCSVPEEAAAALAAGLHQLLCHKPQMFELKVRAALLRFPEI